MVTPLDDPQTRNEETYDQLISLIENTQGRLAPIIVACDDNALRQRIILRYESEARQAKIRPYRLILGQEPSLREGLEALKQQEEYLRQGGAAVFTVTGAELLLRVKLNPQEEQNEVERFFGYLQWTREGLQAFRYPIVLWVPQRLFQEMRYRAPDFWSWRKAELRFADESPHAPRLPIVAEPSSQRPTDVDTQSLPPLADLQAEITTLIHRDPDSRNLATLYDRLGQVYAQRIRQGNAQNLEEEREQTIAAFQQAIRRYHAQNDPVDEMWAHNRLGNFLDSQSRYQEAIACYEKVLDIARTSAVREAFPQESRYGDASSLLGLGNAYQSLGQHQQAIYFFQQSLEIQREIGDLQDKANSLMGLGNAYESLGQYQRAIDFHQQALEIQREIGDRDGEGGTLCNLGNAYQALNQHQRAIEFYQEALNVQREAGNREFESNSLGGLGDAYRSLEQYQRAIDFHQQSLKIRDEIGDLHGEADSLFNLAGIFSELDRAWDALQHYQQAQQIYQSLGLEYKVEACTTAIYQLNQIIPAQPVQRAPEITPANPAPARRRRKLSRRWLVFYGLVGLLIGLLVWWLTR